MDMHKEVYDIDNKKTIGELKKEIVDFRNQRNWKQFHNPKDLAISIMLEASELLEVFQWSANDLYVQNKLDQMEEELADIFIYCILMADTLDVDINRIIEQKIKKNSIKYPVEKSFGSKVKYTEWENK